VLPYAPYRSLSISKLFCKDGECAPPSLLSPRWSPHGKGGGGVLGADDQTQGVEGFVMNSEGISGRKEGGRGAF